MLALPDGAALIRPTFRSIICRPGKTLASPSGIASLQTETTTQLRLSPRVHGSPDRVGNNAETDRRIRGSSYGPARASLR
ncbi:hypothetical protein DNM49_16810 [Salmonella enterica subsp. arizonae]|nr:hypothetical protein [Salmonella enterica subsp. arizonae]ECS7299127.1 hypothetical protein [Salmonella enterica]ECE5735132.1 hypothetical protein [Salmonella enterica subsp. arizonae]ECI4777368.1 hypothetical protein [Salmonella enterica subsp. arizonae]ECI4823388.1 hypothetical protein [Salmonella enterica subsp. arizonae]